MSRIVDASVLVKMLCDEPSTTEARTLFLAQPILIAPDHARAEVFNALWKKTRAGLYRREQLELVPAFLDEILSRTFETVSLVHRAASLSIRLHHPIYDCLYLALAEQELVPLVSADRKLLTVGQQAGVAVESFGMSRIQLPPIKPPPTAPSARPSRLAPKYPYRE